MPHTNKAFTLIELLVVIAIIGILASVLLVSLNTARDRARIAAAKSELSQMRSEAELYYAEMGSYTKALNTNGGNGDNVCGINSSASVKPVEFYFSAVKNIQAAGGGYGNCIVSADGNDWVAYFKLQSNPLRYFCVDSDGAAVEISNNIGGYYSPCQ